MTTPDNPLTDRERQVLSLVAQGLTNSAIGGRLYVSENTVKTHLRKLGARFDTHTRIGTVLAAAQRGLITLPSGTTQTPPAHVAADAVEALAQRWQGKAPVRLLEELRGLCGGTAQRRSA